MMSGGGGGRGGGSGGDSGSGAAAVVTEIVEPEKEKDAFDIKLTVVDPKSKIKIIKEVRALTGLGLKEVLSQSYDVVLLMLRLVFNLDFNLQLTNISIIYLKIKWINNKAKDLVEKAPVIIKAGVKKEEVEAIKKILTEAGAQIEIL